YHYPHPEQLTLPRYIKVKNVTNKGSVLPIEYYQLTSEVCRLGLASKEPIDVKGQSVVPYDFAMTFIKNERERILKETGFGEQRGAMSIVVKGKKAGKTMEYRIHTYSSTQALGEGTGIPAAAGAIMMQRGQVAGKGVLPPEGCIKPMEFINVYRPLVDSLDAAAGKSGQSTVLIEQVDDKGNITVLDF
ncbi:saccharopine dehydrogenase, partial [bacterium]|nr:saccharopine dehydrogenase [bacterium]